MQFKIQKVVFEQCGENVGTISPLCFEQDFTGDIQEKVMRFISHDWDQKTEVNRYEIKEIVLPCISGILNKYTKFRFAVGLSSVESLENLSEEQYEKFCELADYDKYIFGQLWEKRKSPFCADMFNQLIAYLQKQVNGEKTYVNPFSEKQYGAIQKFRIYPSDASAVSNKIYWSKF